MGQPVKERYDFVLIFDVQDGNPNGDPDAGNLPRVDPETGCGLVTDVCLKRKVRNFVQLTKELKPPFNIYVREKAILGNAHFEAFRKLGISTGEASTKKITPEFVEAIAEMELPEGLAVKEDNEKGPFLVVEADADKATVKSWLKESGLSKPEKDLINSALKDSKPRRPTSEESDKGKEKMCQDYFDVRTFGAVMSLKSAPNCGQVRGPVQMTFARSIDPIVTLEHSITRMAVATQAEAEKQHGDNRTMGRKNTVPYGVYVSHGFFSPHLAAQTGFSQEDLDLFWKALENMFEHDRSAARGLMATRKLVIFKHDSALGDRPAHQLFDRVVVEKRSPEKPARSFEDYVVRIDGAESQNSAIRIDCAAKGPV